MVIHYYIHKNPPLVPVLSYMSLVYSVTSYFCKTYINTILLCTLLSPKWSLPFRFSYEFCMDISLFLYILLYLPILFSLI